MSFSVTISTQKFAFVQFSFQNIIKRALPRLGNLKILFFWVLVVKFHCCHTFVISTLFAWADEILLLPPN